MDGNEVDEEREVAWLAMPEKAPVVGESGEEIGRMEELLGDREDDIFQGIVLKLARGGHKGGGLGRPDPEDHHPEGVHRPRGGRARAPAADQVASPGVRRRPV